MLSRPGERLDDHIKRVMNSYKILCRSKGVDLIIQNIINAISKDENLLGYESLINEMVIDILLLHDLGKNNPYFQAYISNEKYKDLEYSKGDKEHSLISCYYYLHKYQKILKEIKKINERKKMRELVIIFAYLISRHHGALEDFDKGILLQNIEEKYKTTPLAFYGGFDIGVINFYKNGIYNFKTNKVYYLSKFMFGVLTTCDFMAVHEFKKNRALDIEVIDDELMEKFKFDFESDKRVKGIRAYSTGNKILEGINKYRCDMFIESNKELNENKNARLYFLEAPTGCGKSLTGINLTLEMLDTNYNKIIYVAPFTNIIEQTYKDINNIIGKLNNKYVVNINYKEEIATNKSDDDTTTDYDVDSMDYLIMNYPISVISHIKLFNILVGNKRREMMPISLLGNSIIVLDEIQSYKNKLWMPIINLLKEYSEVLNLKIIIMSATLPKMTQLIEEKTVDGEIRSLIKNREYYYNFFKNRFKPDFTLLKELDIKTVKNKLLEKIHEEVEKGKRIIIGTITIKTCDELYKEMKSRYSDEYEVYRIKGSTSNINKRNIIAKLKAKENNEYLLKKVILVATQCVEAGVDIDMEVGFKNIAILDSDEQFCGRIQREFKGEGIVYFFEIDEVGKIYKYDYRAVNDKTLKNTAMQKVLESKDFEKLYIPTYEWIKKKEMDNYLQIKKHMCSCKFITVKKDITLLEDNGKVNLLMVCKYKSIDGEIIDMGLELEKYNKIATSKMDYGQKEIFLSRFRKIFDIFSYTISKWDFENIDTYGEFGHFKLIRNALEFYSQEDIENGYIQDTSEVDMEKLIEGEKIF